MVGWSDQLSDSRTTISYGTYSKVQYIPPDTNPDQISGQCALIFPFERGTSFTPDPHILYS